MTSSRRSRLAALDTETVEPPQDQKRRMGDLRVELALTVIGHPDVERIGEVSLLDTKKPTELSRISPDFAQPGVGDTFPLADPLISRKPIVLTPQPDGAVDVTRIDSGTLEIDGRPVTPPERINGEDVDRGVVLDVSNRITLLLHRRKWVPRIATDLGLVGESSAIHELRDQILRIADLEVPVLLRGETGTGKELVAQALHTHSQRAERPYHAVNMAAIHANVAGSELFGHKKGAFTGASDDHEGYFAKADGGTLFLDEVGETPIEVQVMLLRTLETGAIQTVGGGSDQKVDVRLITATDANLEALVKSGGFRAPLLHRLAGYDLHLPPLRERKDDIGRLLFFFLRQELEALGAVNRLTLDDPKGQPWMSSKAMSRLARYDWPGNVRQLRNVARQLAIANRDAQVLVDDRLERLLPAPEVVEPAVIDKPSPKKRRRPAEVTEEELAEALKKNRWRLEQSAEALNISRASLYMLIEKSDRFRKAKDLSKEELLEAHQKTGGDLDQMSELLEVSRGGLRLRMKEIGAATE